MRRQFEIVGDITDDSKILGTTYGEAKGIIKEVFSAEFARIEVAEARLRQQAQEQTTPEFQGVSVTTGRRQAVRPTVGVVSMMKPDPVSDWIIDPAPFERRNRSRDKHTEIVKAPRGFGRFQPSASQKKRIAQTLIQKLVANGYVAVDTSGRPLKVVGATDSVLVRTTRYQVVRSGKKNLVVADEPSNTPWSGVAFAGKDYSR